MVQSTQRSDVTMTESGWDYMKRLKQLRRPKSIEELWQILKEAWNNLHTKFPDDGERYPTGKLKQNI